MLSAAPGSRVTLQPVSDGGTARTLVLSAEGGWCDAPGANQTACTWKATVDKVVNKTCSDDLVYTAIETYDAAHDGCEDVGVDQYHSSGRRQLDASTCARARSTALAAGDGKNAWQEDGTAE